MNDSLLSVNNNVFLVLRRTYYTGFTRTNYVSMYWHLIRSKHRNVL